MAKLPFQERVRFFALMDDNSLLHEKSSGFSKLTHEALVEISSRLDGKSLAKLQLVNKQTWSAAGDNAAWR